jgi:hypothetical protein
MYLAWIGHVSGHIDIAGMGVFLEKLSGLAPGLPHHAIGVSIR